MPPPIDMNRFEQIRASGDLPSPKGVALAVIRLTRQQDVSIAELARVISGDPAFVGRIIKAANGLLASSRRPVASVQDALMILGLPAVRTMVLGFSLLSNHRHGNCRGFDYNAFWNSSLAIGLAMQVFAERTRCGAPDELFSLGLLSRVGELSLATLYPFDYARVLDAARQANALPLVVLEQEEFALSHVELTGAMLADWGLPTVFVDAAGHAEIREGAEYPEAARLRLLVECMAAARCIAAICLADESARSAMMPRLLAAGARLRFNRENLLFDCDRIIRLWVEWGTLLQLEQKKAPSFSELAQGDPGELPGELGASDPAPAAQAPAEDPEPVRHIDPAHPRILIVDDEPRTRTSLRGVLEQGSFEVFEAGDGRQGMELALELQPQMMILDWDMPGMSGPELTRALRQTRVGQAIYIVLLTHQGDDERLIEAFDAGADDFVTKPVRPRVLSARLRAGLRVVRLQQELEREREEIRHFAAQLAVTNRRLQEAALTDALTGFPNRRYALDRVQQEWASASRWGRPLSCMIIDIDNFKQINDTYGHDVGDEVLRRAAEALRGALRGQDVICRTGGDEFLAICPETDLARALSCAERLRMALDSLALKAGEDRLPISGSIGVAMRVRGMVDVDALIKEADRGAYLAKQRGRNCIASVQSLEKTQELAPRDA
ncbi:diguanylate cyclase [Azoarcus sp. KH32C]|uniref:GGDEF domain-containing response regulator n=1 Tax=Azoarcus sp. KH32C TaxID=748247 RepID=UPI0002387040|nr:diguanylate cyclase [Azoarcus sp. KH32C]BAL25566.1 response regulator [Azoarcus sp. KH32C]